MNTSWNDADLSEPIIAKSAVKCVVGKVTESGWEDDPFSGAGRLKMTVPLKLAEDAKTVDGDTYSAGRVKTDFIDLYKPLNGQELNPDVKKRNARNNARAKELVLSVLGLPKNSKENAADLLEKAGGWPAMEGKPVVVRFGSYESNTTGETKQAFNGYAKA